MNEPLVAQPRLRWRRDADWQLYLEQWFAQDLPSYMRDISRGEWRLVETVDEPYG